MINMITIWWTGLKHNYVAELERKHSLDYIFFPLHIFLYPYNSQYEYLPRNDDTEMIFMFCVPFASVNASTDVLCRRQAYSLC